MASDIYGSYLSTADAAIQLHLNTSTIWRLIQAEKLKATHIGNGNYRKKWGISIEDLTAFEKQYVKYKKPEGCYRNRPSKKEATELQMLKGQLKEVSEQLLDISARLEDLSK